MDINNKNYNIYQDFYIKFINFIRFKLYKLLLIIY
jgi:hypothetical protein